MNVNSSKKSSVLETQITNQIGGSRNRGKNTPISPVLDDHHLQQQHIHTQTQSYSYPQKNQFQNLTHLPIPFPPPQPTHQPPRFHYHHDHEHEQPISNHQSTTSQKPFFSTPHKRTSSIMTTALSHSPSLSSFPIHRSDFTTKPNNGDVYEGEIHKGRCSGSGVYYYYMSGRYEGDWIDDKYDGYGVETWAKGSRYRGQYRQGLRHGIGVYRFYAGDVYAGEWSNGQCHGSGIHTCEDGSRYVGEFKWGVKHGFGHYHFRNGDTYAGEYFADKMHGFGVYQFGNGHQYEGAWHEGRRQGLGMYTFRNGEAQSGHWQNGVLDVPVLQDSLSKSLYAVSHSKVLNAVQEARRAAEKAYGVAKVDDRINKTVAAANKAANASRVAAVKAVQVQMYHNSNDGAPTPFV
ncbi:conserved hypothetical protein [Ricinus communis]|uniref:1-phosphatidylinositol-4-phosphate 5-kinase n=1 Tax=Ricinus communis TaxID=3988 RepID=B9RUR1_RICCO|nr:conserved hypothetical protein [Ricinus communis]